MNERFKEVYDSIGEWDKDLLPFTKKLKWEGMTMVGVLADYALYYNSGIIIEIGMGASSVYLNKLGEKYNRVAYHCDIQGGQFESAATVPGYFREDRTKCIFYCGSSDSFFATTKLSPVAFAFIDGNHSYEQARKDFFNVYNLLQDNGIICLHDTYPPHEDYLREGLCGSSYKLRQELEKDERLNTFTFPFSVAFGVGLTVCRKKNLNSPFYQQ